MTTREVDGWVLWLIAMLGAKGEAAETVERLLRMGLFCSPAPSVGEAADKIGVSHRALTRLMARKALPPPKTLIQWGRVIRALARYGAGDSLESAAHLSGFESQSALSAAVARHVGIHAVEWRRHGASMDALVAALTQGRAVA